MNRIISRMDEIIDEARFAAKVGHPLLDSSDPLIVEAGAVGYLAARCAMLEAEIERRNKTENTEKMPW